MAHPSDTPTPDPASHKAPEDAEAPAAETAPETAPQTPGAAASAEAPAEATAPEDPESRLGALSERLAAVEAALDQAKAERLAALAEAQNVQRRADKRIEDNAKYAISNFAKALLGVADNLERALLAAPPAVREANQDVKNLAVGVEMTASELQQVLSRHGVSRLESLEQPFDPNLHQAIQEIEQPEKPHGTVVQVMQEGYLLNDRLLRPAMVVVSRGGPKREANTEAEAAEGVDRQV
ncbi:nucleotide exchange factor GrpE [Roseospirillum parvum]|uniref:Protein GrpE n=1 Tax=Roseospirillum parvum TaxID=83401 RepID=A0A1G8DRT9_9PROT|nr:nucleotide exchange factor GrpE [Roseospirillum parvum]SDH60261.1 molecular chaperone GrpE [Roseospirillum parvum]